MQNRIINLDTVAIVAAALKDLKDEVIFVGGAVISVYTDDPAAGEIRPTKDIDFMIQVTSLADWEKLRERLAQLGFTPDPEADDVISYKYMDISVDVMPAKNSPIGPANKWYGFGFENNWTRTIKEQQIKILSAPCFLATKFEAFLSRGGDYRTSHDFEDIVYVLDNRTTIVQEISEEAQEIKDFLKEQFTICCVQLISATTLLFRTSMGLL